MVEKTKEQMSAREIGEQLSLSERTVVRYRAYALAHGWFEEDS